MTDALVASRENDAEDDDAARKGGIATRTAGRRFDEDEDDDGKTTKSLLSSLSMGELKRRAREARGRFVLSEKAIAAGGDQTTKFGYCLMYLNAIQKSVNKLDFGVGVGKGRGQTTTATTTTRRRYPWEVFERDEEEEEEKKRKTKKQKMEDDQRENNNNSKSNIEKEERKEEEKGGEEEDTKTLAPLMETSGTKKKSSTPRKRRAKDANALEENNEMAIKPIKIRPGRYPGEYCQLCGEHEHMVHVKYASQVLGEGKLVCYECLTNEKKELERKEKELANAKERQKRKERQKNRATTRMEMMISSPTTTPTTSNVDLRNNNNNSSSSPPSGTPSANVLPHHQSSSPISVAVVVDGETVTLNTIVHGTTTAVATTTAIHNAEKIEAIHDVSIACDWCGKDTFRTAGELERHKTKWCIAKAGAVIISDSRIQAKATTSSENEGEQNSDNIGKTIAAKAIANIIAKTEEGERGERKQPKVHAGKYQEALGRMSREHDRLKENLSKEAECNKERDVVVADECAMEAPPDVVTKPSLPGDDDDENDKARVEKATREDTIAEVIKTELVADRGDVDDEKKKDNEDTAIVDNNAQVPPVPGRAEEVLQPRVDLPPLVIDAKDIKPPGIGTINASDIPRKARPSSPHKDPHVGRRTLPLAEVLRRAKDGHPVTRNASSGILPQASVVISDIIEKSTIEPAENFSRRRASFPLDQKHKDEKRRLSGGPSMREFEMKEWRTENVHALHHAKTDK